MEMDKDLKLKPCHKFGTSTKKELRSDLKYNINFEPFYVTFPNLTFLLKV